MRTRHAAKNEIQRRTVGYCRVSTEDQAREGVSLAAQSARIGPYAVAMRWAVADIIEDAGASAKSLKRPGIARLLESIRRGEIERVIGEA